MKLKFLALKLLLLFAVITLHSCVDSDAGRRAKTANERSADTADSSHSGSRH